MKEVELPSGAVLKITLSPFAVSKALYQALLQEMKSLKVDSDMQMITVYKEIFCYGFSSPEIERCLWECFKRCTYDDQKGKGDLKIDKDTFEPVEAREDYTTVCMEVAKENVMPFTKSLFADYQRFLSLMTKNPS